MTEKYFDPSAAEFQHKSQDSNPKEFIDTTSHTSITEEDAEKHQAWSIWAQKHFAEMRVAQAAGLLPKDESWRNVIEHSLVVNAVAMLLAYKLAEANYPINRELVDRASVLHDIAKRLDKESGVGRNVESVQGHLRPLLEQAGYSEEVIQTASHTGRVTEIDLPPSEQISAIASTPIEQLLICYADARTRNTEVVSLETARDQNKEKIPADADFYDEWYRYYSNAESYLFDAIDSDFKPSDITNQSVFEMVTRSVRHESENTTS